MGLHVSASSMMGVVQLIIIFSCRRMLLRHLCDERRTQCRDSLLASTVEPPSATAMAELDELDKGECSTLRFFPKLLPFVTASWWGGVAVKMQSCTAAACCIDLPTVLSCLLHTILATS